MALCVNFGRRLALARGPWAAPSAFTSSRGIHFRPFSSSSITSTEVLRHLSQIVDPDLHRDIVSLNFVKNLSISGSRVEFDLELTTPACPVKDQFVAMAEKVLKENIPGVSEVVVRLTAQKKVKQASGAAGQGLKNVQHIVGVSSCKGGVGKSSVAVNLAYALSNRGARVGILDADIFGPSLPSLVPDAKPGPMDPSMEQQVRVFEHRNVKLMSIGYLKPGESVSLRGPMVSSLVQQLLTMTGWGELDYLVIDMPPGTGDIQLTLAQHASIDGAVIVTTPQQLALVDVVKGVELLGKMNIPTLCLVENMKFFTCTNCDKQHDIWAANTQATTAAHVAEKFGIDHVIALPLDPAIAQGPVTAAAAPAAAAQIGKLADVVVRELSKVKFADTQFQVVLTPTSASSEAALVTFTERRKEQQQQEGLVWSGTVAQRTLRLACKSAVMVDEWTGAPLVKETDIALDVHALRTEMAGRYAVRVDWSDGHHSIYPIKALKQLCGEQRQ